MKPMKMLHDKVDQLLAAAEALYRSGEAGRRQEAELQARWERVLDRWCDLAELALARMDADERQRVEQAVSLASAWSGPYDQWLRDLAEGRCRLPELSAEAMRELMLAWLHPQADGGMVCTACGLEYPRHRNPPFAEWKLLPGRRPLEGPPPWYDLPELFRACPHCGGPSHGSGTDWPHLVGSRYHPWMGQDGYVGLPPQPIAGRLTATT